MPFQLVYKATVGGKVSAEVVAVSGSTICIPKDAAVEFNVKNTAGKAGAWTWTAANCVVARAGDHTGRVTFSTVSASTALPATITATPTAGGAALTVNVIVFSVTGQAVPHDNFGGRATDKLGICEIVKLTATILPAGLNLATYGMTLAWKIIGGVSGYKTSGSLLTGKDVTGGGAIVVAPATPGTALFIAPWKPHTPNVAAATEMKTNITLSLQIDGGIVAAMSFAKKVYGIVTPHAHMVRDLTEPLHHFNPGVAVATPGVACVNEEPSAGFKGQIYLTPKDVSFARIRWREGVGTMRLWGACLANSGEEGLQHHDTVYQNAIHGTVTGGNSATGCQLNQVDNVHCGAGIKMPAFITQHGHKTTTVVGGKTWPIDWKYTFKEHNGTWGAEFVIFQKAFHTFEVRGNGTSTCVKRCATRNCDVCMDPVEGAIGAAHEWP